MIEIEGSVPLPPEGGFNQLIFPFGTATGGPELTVPEGRSSEDPVLQSILPGEEDEWIPTSFSILLPFEPGGAVDPETSSNDSQSDGQEIVINGPRFHYDLGGGGGTGGGDTGGGGSGGGGDGGAGDSGGGSAATVVETHEQDCGTDDGAAVQVANHVKGPLPAGVSGPENPIMTASGKDWTSVEFGTMIVKNPDSSYGALNNAIYSNDLPGEIQIQYSSSAPVQGFWHSHPGTDRSSDQRLIDRYPSITTGTC